LDEVVCCAGDCLAVGFHGELLEVGREAVEILVESVAMLSASISCHHLLTVEKTYGETKCVCAPKKSE
jgi:hypothetical protein